MRCVFCIQNLIYNYLHTYIEIIYYRRNASLLKSFLQYTFPSPHKPQFESPSKLSLKTKSYIIALSLSPPPRYEDL
ncbi:hypothetical protein EYC84_005543 [Monilinia fructicola]|uniref:Uncharacterized protein n=1 Tax=Monilinia fructicola TaxID=38448 RepID=A0A5M9K1J7_MONFR|nr:hypothetical protein EYC84_005543 [Monilinia fructicola]